MATLHKRFKLRLPAPSTVLHYIVVEAAFQLMWWIIYKVFSIDRTVRDIGILVAFTLGIIVVAWYLPKIWPKGQSRGAVESNSPPVAETLPHGGISELMRDDTIERVYSLVSKIAAFSDAYCIGTMANDGIRSSISTSTSILLIANISKRLRRM